MKLIVPEKLKKGDLIGVVAPASPIIGDNIEEIQNADLSQQMHGNFEFIESKDVTESYKCMYQIQSGEIELCHIFSDYSSIMEK